ncbi:MAG: hypothetical protein MZV64_26320 [Ignavibacteriales bacterium]|nr:hypothetical protein [Ignavibacteriales bacterium]
MQEQTLNDFYGIATEAPGSALYAFIRYSRISEQITDELLEIKTAA